MEVKSAKFGTVDVSEDRIIEIPEGLFGFPGKTRYCILSPEEDGPFFWMQCADDPDLAVVVVDPMQFVPDYSVSAPADEWAGRGLAAPDGESLQVLVAVNKAGDWLTANLRAPIMVNVSDMTAVQMILTDSDWSVRHRIVRAGQGASP